MVPRALTAMTLVTALAHVGPGVYAAAADVYSGCTKNGKLVALRTDAEAVCTPGEVYVTWTQGVQTITGLVNGDGTTALGTGFTTTRIAKGEYRITFPAGTWRSFPVVTVSSFGLPGAFTAALVGGIVGTPDGSVEATVVVSSTLGVWTRHDSGFFFIAAGTVP